MELTIESRVIFVSKPFVLGFCACGCGEEIPVRYHHYLKRFVLRHANRGRTWALKRGEEYHQWKGGVTKVNGYVRRYVGYRKYRSEHIHIFQEHHKCCLLRWGVVHHRDGNRSNNEIENLEGMTRAMHTKLHNDLRYSNRDL